MKVNRFLRVAVIMLLITALLIPAAARFGPYSFRFSLGQAGVGPLIPLEPGVVATGGFDVVHATTHIFHAGAGVPGITIANTGTRQLDIYREGWYAFVIRGGDGGPGNRTANNVRSAMGGAGGMVMGYVWLAAGTRVYVHLAAAGHRTTSAQTNRPATGGGLGSAHGGEGGGATVLSTGSAPTHANAIAIAGGGGGGGGINQVGTTDHANNRGGDAGGTGFTGGATHQYNPILNGAVMRGESTTNIPGVGVVSGGFRGGNPENTNITKNTARPGNTGSDGGGGGGGHNAGGQHGATANAAASIGAPLLGGNGTAWGGGGGSGWYGGGGGFQHTGAAAWNGGGGGGSSFVRHDVRALTPEMMTSSYFAPFIALGGSTDATRVGATNNVGNAISGVIPLRNTGLNPTANHPGWQGFAVMMYLGPQDPAQWSHANTFNTWFNAATVHDILGSHTLGGSLSWSQNFWELFDPIAPATAGYIDVNIEVRWSIGVRGTTGSHWHDMPAVTRIERMPNGDIILHGTGGTHGWGTNPNHTDPGSNFTNLRIANNGTHLNRLQGAGWNANFGGGSGQMGAGTLTVILR